ncbi:MAG: PEP-CTERM system histidine kinase PrsK [Candidatus Methylomirabilis sp.]|nr:PEP-CTERM system histidine kinase PrsK [Deltaproteobacteria bacterium]
MTTLPFALNVLSAAMCAGLGLFTLLRNPRHLVNIGFASGMACLAVIEAGSALALLAPGRGWHTGMRLNLTGQAMLPAAWMLFSLVFARANHREILSKWISALILFTLVSAAFAYLAGSPSFIEYIPPEPDRAPALFSAPLYALGPVGKYFYIFVLLGLVLNLVHLENTLKSSSGQKRWQIKYIIFGVGGVLAYYVFLSSQALLFSAINAEMLVLASVITIITVSMTAVFIVRHRLLEVDIFVSRYVVYGSFTVLLAGLYLIGIGVVIRGIRHLDIPLGFFFTALFVFVSLLFLALLLFTSFLRRKVQLFINRHFYSHKYEFRDKWMETIEKMSSKRSIGEITSTLIELISETTGARGVRIWLLDPVSGRYVNTASGQDKGPGQIGNDHPLSMRIKTDKDPFFLSEIPDMSASLPAWPDAVLCAPLVADDDPVGFALLGSDISGEKYRQDDFDILKAMTTQAAVQIKNMRLDQDVMSLKAMEGFSKASAFIMHDLKNLTNTLSLVSQNARHNMNDPSFQKDAINTIDATVGRMKTVIERLSASNEGLVIRPRDTDLRTIVNGALGKLAFTEKKDVRVSISLEKAPIVTIDPEVMEMVFLNLLTNAFDSIDGRGEVSVNSEPVKGGVLVTVSDTGSGMRPEFVRESLFRPFMTTKRNGFGIGLYQCKNIIEAHGGTVDVESSPGAGTAFRILFPGGTEARTPA